MARGPAHIQSPDVIKNFRVSFITYSEQCRTALDDVQRDITRVQQWLEHDQSAYWKREYRKRSERAQLARSEYNRARNQHNPLSKDSCVDEKNALDKALRMQDEAEEKLRAVKKALMTIEQNVSKSLGPCLALSSMLAVQVPKAVARLDRMLDTLDAYLRPSPGQAPQEPR
jgi:hypothetical protein